MTEGVTIRPMGLADVEVVSRMIVRTVRETNAKDYPPSFVAAMITKNAPREVLPFWSRKANRPLTLPLAGRADSANG